MTTSWPPKGWIDQGQCLGDGDGTDTSWTPFQKRATICQIANACVGMKPTDAIYRDGLYPWDSLVDADYMVKKQYKCALTVLMLLRAFGFVWPHDGKPYAGSFRHNDPPHAMAQMQGVPQWEANPRILPQPGEAGIIHVPGDNGLTHGYLCIEVKHSGGRTVIVSVDGGHDEVHITERTVALDSRGLWLKDKNFNRLSLGVLHTGSMVPSQNWLLPDR